MSRPRSPETEVRRLRHLLRLARTGFRLVEDRDASDEHRRRYADDMIRQIDNTLSPRRPRRRS